MNYVSHWTVGYTVKILQMGAYMCIFLTLQDLKDGVNEKKVHEKKSHSVVCIT